MAHLCKHAPLNHAHLRKHALLNHAHLCKHALLNHERLLDAQPLQHERDCFNIAHPAGVPSVCAGVCPVVCDALT